MIPSKYWRGLQKAFREADGSARTGLLNVKQFASVLSKYNVFLTPSELMYASNVSGGTGNGDRGRGPKIVHIGTLATRSAKRKSKVVRYGDFLTRFVDGKVLLGGLKRK